MGSTQNFASALLSWFEEHTAVVLQQEAGFPGVITGEEERGALQLPGKQSFHCLIIFRGSPPLSVDIQAPRPA